MISGGIRLMTAFCPGQRPLGDEVDEIAPGR